RMTVVPSLVEGGVKSNSVPDRAELRCDVRSLPHQDREEILAELRRLAAELPGVEVELVTTAHSNQSGAHLMLEAALREAASRAAGAEVDLLPGLGTGFTDSRFFR